MEKELLVCTACQGEFESLWDEDGNAIDDDDFVTDAYCEKCFLETANASN